MPVDAVLILLLGTFTLVFAVAAVAGFIAYRKAKDSLSASRTEIDTLNQHIIVLQQKAAVQPVARVDSVALIAKTVVQTLNVAVIVLNKTGTIIFINPYAELLLGRRRDEVIGKPYKIVFRLVNERDMPDDDFLTSAVEQHIAISNRLSFLYQLAGKIPVVCFAMPLSATDGFEGALFAFSNAGEQYAKDRAGQIKNAELAKEAQRLTDAIETLKKETELSQSIFEGIHSAIFIFDHEGKLLTLNPSAEKLTGIYKAEALHQQYQQMLTLTTRDGKPSYIAIESALAGNTGVLDKWTYITSKSEKVPVVGGAIPLLARDNTLRVLVTLQDASDDYIHEEEEKAFFSAAAHDLRTPLTSLRTLLELLNSSLSTLPKEKVNDMLGNANTSLMQLINLVNDLLSVSRIEQGRLEITREVFDLVALTQTVVKDMSVLTKERKLYLRFEPGDVTIAKVLADKSKTREVLTNLISNAVKYTLQGGVTISQKITDDTVHTIIADTGTGISPEHKGLLFRKFQQIGTARLQHSAKSTGLGLYITKKFSQMMGGDVVLITSEPGVGSTFEFTLPLANDSATSKGDKRL